MGHRTRGLLAAAAAAGCKSKHGFVHEPARHTPHATADLARAWLRRTALEPLEACISGATYTESPGVSISCWGWGAFVSHSSAWNGAANGACGHHMHCSELLRRPSIACQGICLSAERRRRSRRLAVPSAADLGLDAAPPVQCRSQQP